MHVQGFGLKTPAAVHLTAFQLPDHDQGSHAVVRLLYGIAIAVLALAALPFAIMAAVLWAAWRVYLWIELRAVWGGDRQARNRAAYRDGG